jgi:hypothetical protein
MLEEIVRDALMNFNDPLPHYSAWHPVRRAPTGIERKGISKYIKRVCQYIIAGAPGHVKDA